MHAVVGRPGSGKSALVASLAEAHPDWLGFVNVRTKDLPNLVQAPAGCPCCSARVVMEVRLVGELRRKKPARVYIELPDPAHATQLARVLRTWPLSQYVEAAAAVELP